MGTYREPVNISRNWRPRRAQWTSHLLGPLATAVATRQGRVLDSPRISEATPTNRPTSLVAHKSRVLANRAEAKLAALLPDGSDALRAAAAHASMQRASLWVEHCAAIRAVTGEDGAFAAYVRASARSGGWPLSRIAELVSARLDHLGEIEQELVRAEVRLRPDRWRTALRIVVDGDTATALSAARLLEQIGDFDDVPRLRRLARKYRGRPDAELGRALARRIATRVTVEDQGRVAITIGARHVDGSSIRRKVLALLCFLLTRPRFAATRDEVMDALWPEFDPADALNSLNQTVYFLRRVFEPALQGRPIPGLPAPRVGRDLARHRTCRLAKQSLLGAHTVNVAESPRPTRSTSSLRPTRVLCTRLRVRGMGDRLPDVPAFLLPSDHREGGRVRHGRAGTSSAGLGWRDERWT